MNSKNFRNTASIVLILVLFSLTPFVGNNNAAASAATPDQAERLPLLFNLIWHQHQPGYYDPSTEIYEQPWVYMHSTNSYPYMADVLMDYNVNVTINLTPSLLAQMDDYTSEVAYDRRIECAKMLESTMSFENKSVILQYFFDINPQFVTGRYEYLQNKTQLYSTLEERVNAFTDAELLDLKVMFFTRWVNPRFYEDYFVLENTNNLIDSGSSSVTKFTRSDLNNVLDAGLEIAQSVVTKHNAVKNTGRVEIITTPFYHPILPLLIDLNSARESDPGLSDLPLPEQSTGWTADAQEQIDRGVQSFTDHFGGQPRGMWPSEQAVSEDVIPLVDNAGIEWIVSDKGVLSRGLEVGEASYEQLAQMYRTSHDGSEIAIVYRDTPLSDKVGFSYSGQHPDVAAADFVQEIRNVYNAIGNDTNFDDQKDYVFTVALDGENAWEHYGYDINGDGKNEYTGNLFREALYLALEEAQTDGWLKTTTPAQYLDTHPVATLPDVQLATGSWIWDLNTWIGEPDENVAWDRLITARQTLVWADDNGTTANSTAAWNALYAAQGSDWFWWYGTDQNSGHDELFDWQFKTYLRSVYLNIGWTMEEILLLHPELCLQLKPIYSGTFGGRMAATIDGQASAQEWDLAYKYNDTEIDDIGIDDWYMGIDENGDNLFARLDMAGVLAKDLPTADPNGYVTIYFNDPRASSGAVFPIGSDETDMDETLGFELTYALIIYNNATPATFLKYEPSSGLWIHNATGEGDVAADDILEFNIPIAALNYEPGDFFLCSAVYTNVTAGMAFDCAPQDGPLMFQFPLGGLDFDVIFDMDDPADDEYGIYPTDESFAPGEGLFDVRHFTVGTKDEQVVIVLEMAEMTNPWSSPRSFSHPKIQVYFDKDRVTDSGATHTEQNANVDIHGDFAWEVMIGVDGWRDWGVAADGSTFSGVDAFGDSLEKIITLTAPVDVIGTPTEDWAYVILIGSGDFEAFREVNSNAGQWKFGGGDDGPYDPNTLDVVLPEEANQAEMLTSYSIAESTRAKIKGVGPHVSYAADSVPPVVTITSPTEGATFTAGAEGTVDVTLEFTITDNVEVDHIDVFVDALLEGSDLAGDTTSFTVNLAVGEYTLRVNAYDGPNEATANLGTDAITVTVNAAETTSTPPTTTTTTAEESTGEDGGFLSFGMFFILALLIVVPATAHVTRRRT